VPFKKYIQKHFSYLAHEKYHFDLQAKYFDRKVSIFLLYCAILSTKKEFTPTAWHWE
jgi:hypothetical protein